MSLRELDPRSKQTTTTLVMSASKPIFLFSTIGPDVPHTTKAVILITTLLLGQVLVLLIVDSWLAQSTSGRLSRHFGATDAAPGSRFKTPDSRLQTLRHKLRKVTGYKV